MAEEPESDAMSDEAYDQRAELGAMNAPGALERIEDRQKGVAERLTPGKEKATADVPYVTYIPSEQKAGLGMQMGIRMEEYRAGVAGFENRYMRLLYDEAALGLASKRYQSDDRGALAAYHAVLAALPKVPVKASSLLVQVLQWVGLLRRAEPIPPFDPAAYEVLKTAREVNRASWEKARTAAIKGTTTAGEPDIESLDPRTDFYKLMSSHKGQRAAQLVELGKMGRTEKPKQRRGLWRFGARE